MIINPYMYASPITPLFYLSGQGTNGQTSLTDSTGHTAAAIGTAAVSNTQHLVGSTSLYIGTAGATNNGWQFGYASDLAIDTSKFTAEGWIYPTDNTSQYYFFCLNDSGFTNYFAVYVRNTGNTIGASRNAGGSMTSPGTLTLNAWNHWHVSKNSDTEVYLGLNGQASLNTGSWSFAPASSRISVGRYNNNGFSSLPGNMAETRVVKGMCLYPGTTYTVPTPPLS